jgi:hypothetical protein
LKEEPVLSEVLAREFAKQKSDAFNVAELYSGKLTKPFSNSSAVLEDSVIALTKVLNEQPSFDDDEVIEFFKILGDSSVFSEQLARVMAKPLTDAAVTVELVSNILSKQIEDRVSSTDDWDGSASIEDDQEMYFTKQMSEIAAVTDVIAWLLTAVRNFEESALISDTGSLRSQGYCDFSYFAEDYVGASRTF